MRCKHLQLSQPVTEHADFTVLHKANKASHEERLAGQQTWLQRNEPSSRLSQIKIYKPSSGHFGAPESKRPSVISAISANASAGHRQHMQARMFRIRTQIPRKLHPRKISEAAAYLLSIRTPRTALHRSAFPKVTCADIFPMAKWCARPSCCPAVLNSCHHFARRYPLTSPSCMVRKGFWSGLAKW